MGPVGESVHDHPGLEKRRSYQGTRQNSTAKGDGAGKAKDRGRPRSYAGLENHVKTFRLHPKTNGQLSKDFKLMGGMRFSFHAVWPFSAGMRSTGRYRVVPYKHKLLSLFSTPFLILLQSHSRSGYNST